MFSSIRFGANPYSATSVKFGLIPDSVAIQNNTIYKRSSEDGGNREDDFIKTTGPVDGGLWDIIHCDRFGNPVGKAPIVMQDSGNLWHGTLTNSQLRNNYEEIP